MMHKTLAVIGHVDHGKTSLVRALTGIDTDTLIEEKQRGLSIALGFASMQVPTGHVHLVDTPGHADFVRMTASGLSGADAILLVISAVDGVQPQTTEHVRLAELFGVRKAIVAVTKSDLASAALIDQTSAQVGALLRAHGFKNPDTVICSSTNHTGLEPLSAKLAHLCTQPRQASGLKGFFLPIDRVFSAPGAGTVVTGTLLGKTIKVGEDVVLEPNARRASIRTIQVAGIEQPHAAPGTRVAVNLRGVDATSIRKGHVLCAPDGWATSKRFDVSLIHSDKLKHMEEITILLGTAHASARIRLYPDLNPHTPYGQIEFREPAIAFPGQRFVLRRPASAEILTGGIVLDPKADLITRNKSAHVSVLRAIETGDASAIAHALADRNRGIVALGPLKRTTHETDIELGPEFELTPHGFALRLRDLVPVEGALLGALTRLHADRPCRPYITMADIENALQPVPETMINVAIDRLMNANRVHMIDHGLALVNRDPFLEISVDQRAAYDAADHRLIEMGLHAEISNESADDEASDIEALLVYKSRAVRLFNHSLRQSLLLSADAIDAAERVLRTTFSKGQSFTTSAARQALDTNRKTVVPLLEYFDKIGITQRIKDARIIRS